MVVVPCSNVASTELTYTDSGRDPASILLWLDKEVRSRWAERPISVVHIKTYAGA